MRAEPGTPMVEIGPDRPPPRQQVEIGEDNPRPRLETESEAREGLPVTIVSAAIVAGAVVRLVVLLSPLGRPDADEVITGLMARDVVAGRGFPLFFWGQHYGGTVQLVPVSVSTAVLGPSLLGLRVPTWVLAVLVCVLTHRIATRLVPTRSAQVAGLLMWLGPPVAVWFGLREMLFYQPTVVFGLALGLVAVRVRGRARWQDVALLAGLTVIGLWTSPNIAYFAVPAAVVVIDPLARLSTTRSRTWAGAALVGALAIAAWTSDRLWEAVLTAAPGFPLIGSYGQRLAWFGTVGLPALLGFREALTHRWVFGLAGVIGFVAAVPLLGAGWWRGLRSGAWDAVGLLAVPIVFAFVPFGPDQPNLRYLFFAVPFVAVALARLATTDRRALAALGLALVVTIIGLGRLADVSERGPAAGPTRVGNVGDVAPALAVVRDAGVDGVLADYWVAYRVAFEQPGHLPVAPTWGIDRNPVWSAEVRAARRPAWIVARGPQLDALRSDLRRLGVGARDVVAGELVVVLPERPVWPEEVSDRARAG